jgi:chemotaxis protein CheY-P-specific phosphatase CheC
MHLDSREGELHFVADFESALQLAETLADPDGKTKATDA